MIVISRVDEGIYRGAAPESSDDYAALQSLGVKIVLNLESGFKELIHHRTNGEAMELIECGILPIHIQMSPIFEPSYNELSAAIKVIRKDFPVYFHCQHGVDRTGVVAMFYRVKVQNWSFEQAKEEALRMGFHNLSYWWWFRRLKLNWRRQS